MFVKTDGGMESAGFTERNDCAVRAYAIYAQTSYAVSHSTFAKSGRKSGKGTSHATLERVLGKESRINCQMTLRALRRLHPTGSVYAVKRGHAFAMVDGVIHDTWKVGEKVQVRAYWIAPTNICQPSSLEIQSIPTTTVANKQSKVFDIYTRLSAYDTLSNYAIAKRAADELGITVANAMYYISKFAKAC